MASATPPTRRCSCSGAGVAPAPSRQPGTSSMTIADPRVVAGMAAQLARRAKLLDSGVRHLGWKAGFASAPARERFGTTGPLVGFLTDRGLLRSGSSITVDGWTQPVLEAEIA